MKDIPKIEKEFEITINLFGYNKDGFYPIYRGMKIVNESKHIDLLITEEVEKNHYEWIKDFDKLNYRQTARKEKKHFCKNCIQCFSSKEILEKHKSDCLVLNNGQAVSLPKENTTISFNHLKKTIAIPFVIYADFEALVPKYKEAKQLGKSTIKYQKHKICSMDIK